MSTTCTPTPRDVGAGDFDAAAGALAELESLAAALGAAGPAAFEALVARVREAVVDCSALLEKRRADNAVGLHYPVHYPVLSC